jgi:hypothetical protein
MLVSNTGCGSLAFWRHFRTRHKRGTRDDRTAAPKDEIEGALAVQMACTHTANMAVLARLDSRFADERRISAFGSAAARLMRAYALQLEVLRRLRNGGQQYVRVEHVHVNDGGQAVVGNVKSGIRDGSADSETKDS